MSVVDSIIKANKEGRKVEWPGKIHTKEIERYLKTYFGRKLIKKYSLNEYGTWRIQGEDPNCDFAGHHHLPDIANVTGTLQEVLNFAVVQPSFYSWGSGGKITKIEIINL